MAGKPAGYLLSEEDRAALREMLRDFQSRMPTAGFGGQDWDDTAAPELYVARTPSGGIPGLTEQAGTGVVDQPGRAECDVYRLTPNGSLFELIPVPGLKRTVNNLSTTAATADVWANVARDKYGAWWLLGGATAAAGDAWTVAVPTAGSDAAGYTCKKVVMLTANTWTFPTLSTIFLNCYRVPTNGVGTLPAGATSPRPDLVLDGGGGTPTGTFVLLRASPTLAGKYEIMPWGGIKSVSLGPVVTAVTGGTITCNADGTISLTVNVTTKTLIITGIDIQASLA